MLFKSPRGTKDVLPDESPLWQAMEDAARRIFAAFAYEEIRTPVFEEAKLFTRSLGDLTDIVQKQMFVIKKETDTFVLRPEATASIVRSYVENSFYHSAQVAKFYYLGPMFRAERPQKGRLRQFHHLGAEAIGSYHPFLDAEAVYLATVLLNAIGVSGFLVVVNTLGCLNDKKRFGLYLREKLLPHKESFCEDCQNRMTRNVFRVLDCKNKPCRNIVFSLQMKDDPVCEDCRRHFDDVKRGLRLFGVDFKVDPWLVRGLDYYTRTVFEITHASLGSQDALGAGGRYDNLVEELGGPRRGAVGFALGAERILLAKTGSTQKEVDPRTLDCYLLPLGRTALERSVAILTEIRKAGFSCDMEYLEGSLKAGLRRADAKQAKICLVIGDNELSKGTCLFKNMIGRTQEEVKLKDILDTIKAELRKKSPKPE